MQILSKILSKGVFYEEGFNQNLPPPIALLLGLCALALLASCDSSGGSDSIPDATTITNGDFESCEYVSDDGGYYNPTGWDVSLGDDTNGWGNYPIKTEDTNHYLSISNWDNSTGKNPNQNILTANATQTVVLYAGSYTATIDARGLTTDDDTDLVFSAIAGGATLATSDPVSVNNWNSWDNTTLTISFTVEDSYAYVTLGITGTLAYANGCEIDNMTLTEASVSEAEADEATQE